MTKRVGVLRKQIIYLFIVGNFVDLHLKRDKWFIQGKVTLFSLIICSFIFISLPFYPFKSIYKWVFKFQIEDLYATMVEDHRFQYSEVIRKKLIDLKLKILQANEQNGKNAIKKDKGSNPHMKLS